MAQGISNVTGYCWINNLHDYCDGIVKVLHLVMRLNIFLHEIVKSIIFCRSFNVFFLAKCGQPICDKI